MNEVHVGSEAKHAGVRTSGKIVLVTGAGSGLGRAIAHRLTDEGAIVVLADRDKNRLSATQKNLPGDFLMLNLDVTDESQWSTAINDLMRHYGRLDGLVNCAGIATGGDNILQCSAEMFELVMRVNVTGSYLGCRAAIPVMSSNASIINIGSIRSLVASADTLAYSTSKSAVLGLTRSVALYCAQEKLGIRANSICPGAIMTEMQTQWLEQSGDAEAAKAEMVLEYPIGRLGEPDDIAWLAVYLISNESGFVTGSHFTIDGGMTAQ